MTTTPGPPDGSSARGHRIAVSALNKVYPDGTQALRDIDLTCLPGEFVVLLGASGSGKTTLLRCLAGLEPATAGSIALDGRDVTATAAGDRDIAMVFQNYGLYPNKTAYANIEFPLRMANMPRAARRAAVAEVAAMLRLEPYLGKRPGQLSGGQKQRVGIGRALVRRPGVLLMDEPLSNLDAELRVTMRKEIRAMQRATGTTTVYVTHDQSEALALADRLVVMRDGRIVQNDHPETVFRLPATDFVARFLGGMNLLSMSDPAVRDAVLGRLPDGYDTSAVATVGVRPEDWVVPGESEPRPDDEIEFTGRVEDSELIGRERLLSVLIGAEPAQVRISADRRPSNVATLRVKLRYLSLFGPDGERLSPAPRALTPATHEATI
ncbi:ABC transporter ATP-binding protein [Dactylosporangium sp. CA-233914]|uniref:ABC transporter ATP-binding protein n=1 Tax=Dactylosporangium sp. CA-233914 TaxID=3239934 RepID=UPI003D8C15B6